MKKKILALCLVVVLVATAITGVTLAYFTDYDKDVNVMTTGNVQIVQNEEQRDENGAAEAFEDNKLLIPAVYNDELDYDGEFTASNGDKYEIFDKCVDNEVDKFITVTNKGSRPAYVRTIIAFEDNAAGTLTSKLHTRWGYGTSAGTNVAADANGVVAADLPSVAWLQNNDGSWMTITDAAGVTYTLAVITYLEPLASKDTTAPSLMQVFLDPTAGNEWTTAVGNEYTIMAISQAVQSEGFDSAAEAMASSFALTQANIQSWFNTYGIKTDDAANVINEA